MNQGVIKAASFLTKLSILLPSGNSAACKSIYEINQLFKFPLSEISLTKKSSKQTNNKKIKKLNATNKQGNTQKTRKHSVIIFVGAC